MNSIFRSAAQKATEAYRQARETLTVAKTESQFLLDGTLSVGNFVISGDHLVAQYRMWKWASDKKTSNEKAYLVYENAVFNRRMVDVEYEDNGDGWTVPTEGPANRPPGPPVPEMNDPVPDMSVPDMNDSDMGEDDEDIIVEEGDGAAVTARREVDLTSRRFKLYITYSRRWETPQMWIEGRDGTGDIGAQAVLDEINSDYTKGALTATATIDEFPYTGVRMVSIHPCNHANVVKMFINIAEDRAAKIAAKKTAEGKEEWEEVSETAATEPHEYLFLFLKIFAAMIPQIELDYST